jgi:hypothetical protein
MLLRVVLALIIGAATLILLSVFIFSKEIKEKGKRVIINEL